MTKIHLKTGVNPLLKVVACIFWMLGLLVFGVLSNLQNNDVQAATSSTINFQARLLQSSGAIVPDGYYHVEFKLYDASTSSGSSQGSCTGDSNCLWTENYTGASTAARVRVANGYLTVNLGTNTAFGSTINWDQELWMTMRIGGSSTSASWDGEMSPRLKLTAVPYAFRARELRLQSGGNSSVLQFASPTGTRTLTLPDETGTVCTTGSVCTGYASSSSLSGYVQLQGATPGTQQTGNINVTGTIIGQTSITSILFQSRDQTASSTNSSNLVLRTGNASGTTSNSGNLTIDVGTATGTAGTISLGTTSASAITIGRTGVNTAVDGGLDVAGHVAIGSAAGVGTSTLLSIDETIVPSGNAYGISSILRLNPASSNGDYHTGAFVQVQSTSANAQNFTGGFRGASIFAQHNGTATLNQAWGGEFRVDNTSTGTISEAVGLYVQANTNSGGGAVTNNYGLYVSDQTVGGTDYGVYIQGGDSYALYVASDPSYFGGTVTANTTLTVNGSTTLGDATGDTLTIQGTAVSTPNNLNIDSNTLYVDAANNRVGIGTATPAERLTVNGNFSVRDADTATKAYRFRTSGSALDLEAGGADLYISTWSGANFTGTQYDQLILDSGGADIITRRGIEIQGQAAVDSSGANTGSLANGLRFGASNSGEGIASKRSATGNQYGLDFYTGNNRQFYISNTGTSVFQNSTNSTTAFQVLNATSGQLVGVDTTNANITLNGLNNPKLQTWQTNSNTLGVCRSTGASVTVYGYVYHIAGSDCTSAVNTVHYAKLNADGTTGTWSTTTSTNLTARFDFSAVTANGYIYVMGGDSGSGVIKTVFYAKVNANGTLSSWTAANDLPDFRVGTAAVAYNGYIYVLGGVNSSFVNQNSVYYSKVQSDGSLGTWITESDTLPAATSYGASVTANGYVYYINGDATYYAKLDTNGNVGTWTSDADIVGGGIWDFTSVVLNGYVYVLGGTNGTAQDDVYYAPLNNDGSIGSFTADTNLLPAARSDHTTVTANGYIYVMEGGADTIYYSSASRVKIGGSVDLVGLGGENLAEGGSGGTLTAGNTSIIGTLDVQAEARFNGSVVVQGDSNVSGYALFQNAADSPTAFQIKNAAGTKLFNVDTTNNEVELGSSSTLAGKLVFNNATNSNTASIQSGTTSSSYTLTLPTALPGSSQCIQSDNTGTLSFTSCGGGSYLAKNSADTSSAAITVGNYLYGLTNSSSAVGSGVLSLTNGTNTSNTLYLTASGNPGAGSALIFASNTNASASGNLIDLQSGSSPTSKFSVNASGNVTASGTYNTNTFTGAALTFGTAGTATVQSAAGQALTLTGHAASTWSTDAGALTLTSATAATWSTAAGNLTLQGGSGTVSLGTSTTLTSNGALTLSSGGSSGLTLDSASGRVTIATGDFLKLGVSGVSGAAAGDIWYDTAANKFKINENGTTKILCNATDAACGAGAATLQGTYTASTGGTTPEIKLDSTRTALDIQDADTSIGSNLFNIRASNGSGLGTIIVGVSNTTIDLLGNNSNAIGTWTTSTALGSVHGYNTSNIANGYIYSFGGGNFTTSTDTYYAKIKSDGTLDTWTTSSTLLPAARGRHNTVYANGYMYLLGGESAIDTTWTNTTYFAKVNSDGSLGSWTATTVLSASLSTASSFAYNGYMYVIGGRTGTGTGTYLSTVYYAKINGDGSLGSWTANSNALPYVRAFPRATVANGYVYVVGGEGAGGGGDTPSGTKDTVFYAKLNANGSIGTWTNESDKLPAVRSGGNVSVQNGYLYYWGGYTGSGSSATTYVTQLGGDGSTGAWSTLGSMTGNSNDGGYAAANGYLYTIGGYDGAAATTTAHYVTTSRIRVSGSLDLVGLGGENLSEGGSGSSLTSGNTKIIGSLEVQDQATFSGMVAVQGALSVKDTANFQNATDSATAFLIRDAAGVELLVVDTTNDRVYIGDVTADAIGTLLILDTKNTTGDPTGVDGAMYYNSYVKKFRCYENGVWENCLGMLRPAARRWTYLSHPGSGTTFSLVGDVGTAGTAGTNVAASTTEPSSIQFTTGATSGNVNHVSGNANYDTDNRITYQTYAQISTNTVVRVWLGVTNQTAATMAGSANPAGNYAAFRFDTGAGDTTVKCITKDNSTQNIQDSAVAPGTGGHEYEIVQNSSEVVFYIDGTRVCLNSVNRPAANTLLRYANTVTTLEAVAKNIKVSFIYVESDK